MKLNEEKNASSDRYAEDRRRRAAREQERRNSEMRMQSLILALEHGFHIARAGVVGNDKKSAI
jgi:hypothetical protein